MSLFALILTSALGACAVGPDYSREAAPVPETYKELKGWKVATPQDTIDRGPWWSVFKDPSLDKLARQVEFTNQNVAAAAAAYEQARATIREAQASLFPTVSASYNVTQTYTGPGVAGGTVVSNAGTGLVSTGGISTTTTTYNPQTFASWSPDIWGGIRRQIESKVAGAQASAANLAGATLLAQTQLSVAYFNLRTSDSLRFLLRRAIADYKRTLEITQNQYDAGAVSRADVITAQTQVLNTQAREINVGVQRAQFEHAIAVLTGQAPADLAVPPRPLPASPPTIPVDVPSTLLERRPDIAEAERTMQQQNAQIGVAVASYYPNITLSGAFGFSGAIPLVFNAANEIWSLGATGAESVFDGGLRGAQVDVAHAAYWQSVANYRQIVLTAFQQVEDQLAAIRILNRELQIQNQAVKAAREAVDVYLNQYRVGRVPFTTVITAQATLLGGEEAALVTRQTLFIASVNLIEALGGGWEQLRLPNKDELAKGFSLLPQL